MIVVGGGGIHGCLEAFDDLLRATDFRSGSNRLEWTFEIVGGLMATQDIRGVDRGVDGWYQAVEVSPADAEFLRVGGTYRWTPGGSRYRIVGVSRKIRPERDGGVVVLLELASARRPA